MSAVEATYEVLSWAIIPPNEHDQMHRVFLQVPDHKYRYKWPSSSPNGKWTQNCWVHLQGPPGHCNTYRKAEDLMMHDGWLQRLLDFVHLRLHIGGVDQVSVEECMLATSQCPMDDTCEHIRQAVQFVTPFQMRLSQRQT